MNKSIDNQQFTYIKNYNIENSISLNFQYLKELR